MKIWKIEATVQTEDDFKAGDIRDKIDFNVNRGEGLYLNMTKAHIKYIKKSEGFR